MESLSSIQKDIGGLIESLKQLIIVFLKMEPDELYFSRVQRLMLMAIELKKMREEFEASGSTSTQDPKQ
jgi:hypothetical protein